MEITCVDLYFSPSYEKQPLPKITLTFLDGADAITSHLSRTQLDCDYEEFGPNSRFRTPLPRPFKQNRYEIYNVFTDKFYWAHDVCLMNRRSALLPDDAKLVGAGLPIVGCLYVQDPFGRCSRDDIIDQMDKRGFSPAQRGMFETALVRRVKQAFLAQVERQKQALPPSASAPPDPH